MFGIGPTEFMVFLVIILLAVGPERLPTFMRTVGKGLREVRRASREFRDAIGLDDLMREDPFRPSPKIRPPQQRTVPSKPASPSVPATNAAEVRSAGPDTVDAKDGDLPPRASTQATESAQESVAKESQGEGDTSAEANHP